GRGHGHVPSPRRDCHRTASQGAGGDRPPLEADLPGDSPPTGMETIKLGPRRSGALGWQRSGIRPVVLTVYADREGGAKPSHHSFHPCSTRPFAVANSSSVSAPAPWSSASCARAAMKSKGVATC